MVCKNRGIYGFLGTLWVLITMPPLINSTASHGDRQKKTNKQKRYPGCPAHAVIGVFYSIVANRRQPSLYICMYIQARASPRWADARLGSAHARNYRVCTNRGRNCDSTAKGDIKNESCLNGEKENNASRFNEPTISNFCLPAQNVYMN